MFGPQAKSQQRIEGHVDSDQKVEILAGTRPWTWRDNSFNQASDEDYSHFNAGFSPRSHQSAHVGFSPKSPCITSVSTRWFQPHITVPYISQHTLASAPNPRALHQSAHAGQMESLYGLTYGRRELTLSDLNKKVQTNAYFLFCNAGSHSVLDF